MSDSCGFDQQSQINRGILLSTEEVIFWPAAISNPTYLEAILDRLIHNAHRIALVGESWRRTRKKQPKPALSKHAVSEKKILKLVKLVPGRHHAVTKDGIIPLQTDGFAGSSTGPVTPIDKAIIETLNGTFRDEW